ncbi:MAG: chemotaxis response regulator protein-glutamate methylesterase [Bacteroidales bacterium]|nr:chemotaxis response regulator protein-glutamate methylesterase [Bacteroidales bacterium]
MIKVLVVDDSAVVRQTLTHVISSDPSLKVIAHANDPFIAVKKIQKEVPDVITLDIEMPRMDGLTFLKKIMSQHPMPVIVISSLTEEGSMSAIKALEYGAVDIITKPQMHTKEFIEESKIRINNAIKAAARAKIKRRAPATFHEVQPKYSADAVLNKKINRAMVETTEKIVAVGASTGGTEAIREFLQGLPIDCPGVIIVQHMPEMFTKSFANRLNDICTITVREAKNGESVVRGTALIAPGNKHMMLKRSGARYYVEIMEGPLVNRHRPSVDVLFRSVASYAGKNAYGIIMTGMGDDGAKGLLEMKEAGAYTVAQDEQSCVVFGMPKEAIKLGASQITLPLGKIAQHILSNKI